MDGRHLVALGLLIAAGGAISLASEESADAPADLPVLPVLTHEGLPISLPNSPAFTSANWNGDPVLVFVADANVLAGVDAHLGVGRATPSVESPAAPGLRVFALSAKSTSNGCTVQFDPNLGASIRFPDYDGDGIQDGRIMDPCHQSTWDAFNRGKVQTGPALTSGDLAVLDIQWTGTTWAATGFDGPVGKLV